MAHDLHLPDGDIATSSAVVVHPHPAMGGDRHHPLVVAVAEGLAATGITALRPDLDNPDISVSATALVVYFAAIRRLADEIPAPLNIVAGLTPTMTDAPTLLSLGVKRVSLGGAIARAALRLVGP